MLYIRFLNIVIKTHLKFCQFIDLGPWINLDWPGVMLMPVEWYSSSHQCCPLSGSQGKKKPFHPMLWPERHWSFHVSQFPTRSPQARTPTIFTSEVQKIVSKSRTHPTKKYEKVTNQACWIPSHSLWYHGFNTKHLSRKHMYIWISTTRSTRQNNKSEWASELAKLSGQTMLVKPSLRIFKAVKGWINPLPIANISTYDFFGEKWTPILLKYTYIFECVMANQGESSEKIVLYNTISYDMTLSDRAPPLLPMPLLRLKARQSQCHSDKGLGKACLSSNRATLYVLWELSNVSVSTGTLLNQDKTDGKTKKKKRKGKIKKTTTTTSTFTRKKRFGFRCLSTILFVELRRVCFRSASTSDGHLDHLAPGRERPYSPGKCQGRNESCISLVSAARSLHSPSVIIVRVSY